MLTIIRETSLDTVDRDDGLRVLLRRTFGAEEGALSRSLSVSSDETYTSVIIACV